MLRIREMKRSVGYMDKKLCCMPKTKNVPGWWYILKCGTRRSGGFCNRRKRRSWANFQWERRWRRIMQCWKEKESRLGIGGSTRPCNLSKIIYEDESVLVYHKPAGLATQSAKVGQPDAVSELKKYLGKKEPYLGIVHRLDQPVEGLLVFAKTKAAAAHLTKQLEVGSLNKQYYATVFGKPEAESGELVDYLLKEGNLAKVVPQGTPQAKKAVLQYQVVKNETEAKEALVGGGVSAGCQAKDKSSQDISRLDIHIDTGRFHQIRVQLAHAGFPILGDLKYGTPESVGMSKKLGIRNVALFAYKLEFVHPVTGKHTEYKIEQKKPY